MEQIAANIYVDSAMPDEARRGLVNNVAEAKSRIAEVYGVAISTPEIVACSTQTCFESFGGGRQRALTFGNQMLLSPRGLTVHIVSHEWSHTEMNARLGWLTRWVLGDLPSWFDEGLAVAVSGEPMHSEEVWQTVEQRGLPRPELTELISNGDWVVLLSGTATFKSPLKAIRIIRWSSTQWSAMKFADGWRKTDVPASCR